MYMMFYTEWKVRSLPDTFAIQTDTRKTTEEGMEAEKGIEEYVDFSMTSTKAL